MSGFPLEAQLKKIEAEGELIHHELNSSPDFLIRQGEGHIGWIQSTFGTYARIEPSQFAIFVGGVEGDFIFPSISAKWHLIFCATVQGVTEMLLNNKLF